MKSPRYLRKLHHRNARVSAGQVIRKPKRINGQDWWVDAYRDDEGLIRYNKIRPIKKKKKVYCHP